MFRLASVLPEGSRRQAAALASLWMKFPRVCPERRRRCLAQFLDIGTRGPYNLQ